MIRGVTLQAADLDRVSFAVEHDAGAFAQDGRWAHAGATGSQDVGAQDGSRRAGQVAVGYLFDERRDVDAGRAGLDARRVETKKAAVGFDDRFLVGVSR